MPVNSQGPMPTEADEALKSRQLFIDIVSVTAVHKVLKRHLIKHNNNNNNMPALS